MSENMSALIIPDRSILQRHLSYDAETGMLHWISNSKYNRFVNRVAGNLRTDGYIQVKICGKNWLAHVIAWSLSGNSFDIEGVQIDHINRIRSDNRLCNLRAVSKAENDLNKGKWERKEKFSRPPKTRKICSVYWSKAKQKWIVLILGSGSGKYLGSFHDQEKALELANSYNFPETA